MTSTELFDREVYVRIGRPGEVGFEFSGLRIDFDIKMSSREFPNKGKIDIYNISKERSAILDDRGRVAIQLFAGYAGRANLIFQGEIRKGRSTTIMNGPDRITRIEAADGSAPFRSARISKTWQKSVKLRRVIEECGKSFGLGSVSIPDDIGDIELTQGFVANGPTRNIMSGIAKSLDFDWFTEFGELKISRKDTDNGKTAVLLSAQTGLVESPKKTNKGVEGISLLNSKIRPKRIVEIRSAGVKGFFLVQKVQYKGSTHGKEFYTKFQCKTAPRATKKAA